MLSGVVTISSRYPSTQVNVRMANTSAARAWSHSADHFLHSVCSHCWFQHLQVCLTCFYWFASITKHLRVEVDAPLLLALHPCMPCVWLWCVLCPCQQCWPALKRTTCRKCDCFWSWFLVPNISDNSRQSFSVTGTCNWSVFNQSREGPTGLLPRDGTSGPAHLSLCGGAFWKAHLSSMWSYRAEPRCLHASVDDEAGLAQFYTARTFGASRLHVFHQLPHAMTRQHLSTTKTRSSCFHICSLKVQPYASKMEWITAAAMTLTLQDLCLKTLHCGSFYW